MKTRAFFRAKKATIYFTASNSILKKEKCPNKSCFLTDDEQHKDLYFHPCKYESKRRTMNKKEHRDNFSHPCSNGRGCKVTKDEEHMRHFTHDIFVSFTLLPTCAHATTCTDKNPKHLLQFRHWCPFKSKCNQIGDVHHDVLNIHLCLQDSTCNNVRNKDHLDMYCHTCRDGQNCKKLMSNDVEHLRRFTHNIETGHSNS